MEDDFLADPGLSKIPTGEPIEPLPPDFANLPFARFIFMDEVVGEAQDEGQPAMRESTKEIWLTPLGGRKYPFEVDLVDDPMLMPEKVKVFQDTMKEFYKFSTVGSLIEYLLGVLK